MTANRRICAALGLKNPMSVDKARSERQKIEAARSKNGQFFEKIRTDGMIHDRSSLLEQKARDKEEQKAVWDGEFLPATSSS